MAALGFISTNMALGKDIPQWMQFAQFDALLAYDNNEYTITVFLDLSKVFDTIDHSVLLKKFECKGIRGLALNWFKGSLNLTICLFHKGQ